MVSCALIERLCVSYNGVNIFCVQFDIMWTIFSLFARTRFSWYSYILVIIGDWSGHTGRDAMRRDVTRCQFTIASHVVGHTDAM